MVMLRTAPTMFVNGNVQYPERGLVDGDTARTGDMRLDGVHCQILAQARLTKPSGAEKRQSARDWSTE